MLVTLAAFVFAAGPAAPTADRLTAAADYSNGHSGQAVVVLFDGKLVFERYAHGGAKDRRQMAASGSKSFVGVAAAAAVEDGLIRLDDPVSGVWTEWKADPKKAAITYRHLLTLTSGLTAGERGTAVSAPAWADIAAKPMAGSPGRQFEYGAYHLNVFAAALERKLGTETFEAYLKRRVLDPAGVTVEWRFKCKDGHPQVGGGAFLTARDWAAFGEFVRRGGVANGKQVVAADRLAECFTGTPHNPAYGLTWWLRKPVTAAQRKAVPILSREWGDVANAAWLPADLVAACGAGKQRLYVIPSRKLVVARMGSLAQTYSDTAFLTKLLGGPAGAAD